MTNYVSCVPVSDEELSSAFKSFDLPAEGRATWEIMKVKSGISRTNNPVTGITFKVLDSKDKEGYMYIRLPMNVEWRVARIGSATKTSEMVKAGQVDIDQWIGKKGIGQIKHEEYNGEKRASWAYFVKPKTTDDFNQKAAASTEFQSPPPSPAFDDDILF